LTDGPNFSSLPPPGAAEPYPADDEVAGLDRLGRIGRKKPKKYGRYVASDYDIEDVMARLLGEPQSRPGASGSWWKCPLCADQNPSLTVDPNRGLWKCFACGKPERGGRHHGPIGAVMAIRGLDFLPAKNWLEGRGEGGYTAPRKATRKAVRGPVTKPPVFNGHEASEIARYAKQWLWEPGAEEFLAYLRQRRLTDGTIRAFSLGCYLQRSRTGDLRGIVIPWYDEGGLRLLKVRRLEDVPRSHYLIVYHRDSVILRTFKRLRTGSPVIITEGEFDLMTIWQELGGQVPVVTLGSSSSPVTPAAVACLADAGRIYVATDNDGGGHTIARKWLAALGDRATRILPPDRHKDWNDCLTNGVDLEAFWRGVLAG
jgi:DNA primase